MVRPQKRQGISPTDIKTERVKGLLVAQIVKLLEQTQSQHAGHAIIGPARGSVKHRKTIFGFEQDGKSLDAE